MLPILDLHNAICQLHPSKVAGRNLYETTIIWGKECWVKSSLICNLELFLLLKYISQINNSSFRKYYVSNLIR